MSLSARLAGMMRTLAVAAGEVVAGLGAALADLMRRRPRPPRPRLGFLGRGEVLALTALAVGLVAGAMLLVDPLVPGLRLRLPGALVVLSERITGLGLGGVVLWPLGLAIVYVLLARETLAPMGRRVASAVLARLGFLFLSVAGAGLLVTVVKHMLGRARPYVALHLPGPNPQLTFDWMVWKSSFASFPSGHATTIFATAVAFGALFPRARWPLIGLAALVAATRVLLGSHYPSDVIAGGAVAAAFVLWLVKIFAARRVVFHVGGDGRVAPMAGPSPRRLGVLVPGAARRSNMSLEEARP